MSLRERAISSKKIRRSNKGRRLGSYFVLIAVFTISLIGVISYVNKYKKEELVLSFNQPIPSGTLIEEAFMSPLPQLQLRDGMIPWEDRDQYIGMYSAHYIRDGIPTFVDMFTDEQALRTPYLYNLGPTQELLTFPYDISEAGGRLVTPGDRLRIRGSYSLDEEDIEYYKSLYGDIVEDEDGNLVFEEDFEGELDEESALGSGGLGISLTNRTFSDIIFDVVEVQDLLNSNNESIVDIINDANRLSQQEREVLMRSPEFINSVTPRAILMVVETEDVNKYVEFEANENPVYTITLLSRNEELKSDELNTGNSLWNILEEAKRFQGIED